MSGEVEIIVGTYEEFLLGYKLEVKNNKPTLLQSFADKSHAGALKCVAIHENWLASGATDDRIFIYNMRQRKQMQILLNHNGSINALAFTPDGTHLLSVANDGRMIATRLSNWQADATWTKAHDGAAVTHISCHPSGKLALSLGADLVLRTWNLVKGRVAYKTNLKSKSQVGTMPDCLCWSPCGKYFILTGQRVIELWCIKTADVMRSQTTNSKPICVCWISSETCLVGLENGKIQWLQLEKDEEKYTEAHENRVKAMSLLREYLVSISSGGEIKLWLLENSKQKLKEIATVNIGCRPTCVALLDLRQFGEDSAEQTETVKTSKKVPQQQMQGGSSHMQTTPRGYVHIQYENDEQPTVENKDLLSSAEESDDGEGQDEENEADSIPTEESSLNESSPESENDKSDSEPQIRAPKSRKRKKQLLAAQQQQKAAKMKKLKQASVKKR